MKTQEGNSLFENSITLMILLHAIINLFNHLKLSLGMSVSPTTSLERLICHLQSKSLRQAQGISPLQDNLTKRCPKLILSWTIPSSLLLPQAALPSASYLSGLSLVAVNLKLAVSNPDNPMLVSNTIMPSNETWIWVSQEVGQEVKMMDVPPWLIDLQLERTILAIWQMKRIIVKVSYYVVHLIRWIYLRILAEESLKNERRWI